MVEKSTVLSLMFFSESLRPSTPEWGEVVRMMPTTRGHLGYYQRVSG
jgi:hypothetical protein